MSNAAKSKFVGFFRGLWGRGDDHPAETHAPSPRPANPAALPAMPAAAAGNGHPQPAAQPDAFADAGPAIDVLALPVAPIIAGLPMELRAKIMSVPPPGMSINIAVETITSQLAFGAVKITFGELRRLASGLFPHAGSDLDQKLVNLPLNEILPRLSPAMLARRAAPKVEVDAAINGPFGGRGDGVYFSTQPLKTGAPPKSRLPVEKDAGPYPFELPPRQTAPAPAPTAPLSAPQVPITFAAPPAFEFPTTKPASPAINNRVSPSAPATPPAPSVPPTPPAPATPPAPVVFKFSAAPAPVPPAPASSPVPPAAAAPRPEPAQPTIFAALWDLAENWPGDLKNEILTSSLANENVALAGALVEAGLKRGRVMMKWRHLRILAKPSSHPSPNDELELELPLKVIAPLFFAAQKKLNGSQKRVAVSSDIPNLFFGFPQMAPTPPAGAPRPAAAKPNDSNFYVWGDTDDKPQVDAPLHNESLYAPPPVPQTDFMSRQAQPKDVVARAKALPGVAGVVIALPDGLRVASDVPVEFNADTLAAFIPQLFERMNQSAKELRMGVLNNVSFTVGNVPWRIYRVNAVYVAAFGRAGESLPGADLAMIAGELDRKKQ